MIAAAAVGGWYVYMQIQDQLKSNQPVAVENYVGLHESDAVFKINERGLTPQVVRKPNDTQPETIVYQQDPAPGNRIDKGNTVTIFVSTGKPKVAVPDVRGKSSVDAVQALADAGMKSKLMTVPSSQPTGTVIAQEPGAGHEGRRGNHRARQRREGADAGRRAARRRRAVRPGGEPAPGAGLRRRAQGRRLDPAHGHRDLAEPGRRRRGPVRARR